jgi:hypothetical protein
MAILQANGYHRTCGVTLKLVIFSIDLPRQLSNGVNGDHGKQMVDGCRVLYHQCFGPTCIPLFSLNRALSYHAIGGCMETLAYADKRSRERGMGSLTETTGAWLFPSPVSHLNTVQRNGNGAVPIRKLLSAPPYRSESPCRFFALFVFFVLFPPTRPSRQVNDGRRST